MFVLGRVDGCCGSGGDDSSLTDPVGFELVLADPADAADPEENEEPCSFERMLKLGELDRLDTADAGGTATGGWDVGAC